jgi:hypothetical protein
MLLVRPRDEQEEADEHNRDTTQRGALSAIGGVSAGGCFALAPSQQRTVEQAAAEDKESPPAVGSQAPIGVGRSGNAGDGAAGVDSAGGGAVGHEDGG